MQVWFYCRFAAFARRLVARATTGSALVSVMIMASIGTSLHDRLSNLKIGTLLTNVTMLATVVVAGLLSNQRLVSRLAASWFISVPVNVSKSMGSISDVVRLIKWYTTIKLQAYVFFASWMPSLIVRLRQVTSLVTIDILRGVILDVPPSVEGHIRWSSSFVRKGLCRCIWYGMRSVLIISSNMRCTTNIKIYHGID
ncbi:hypothetical protein OK016_16715 [Vibrio chagasii]|nr:hypothetical protein [Vibrio chagasii]